MSQIESAVQRAFARASGTHYVVAALVLSLAVHAWHFIVLPVVMTWDGIDYLSLSTMFGKSDVADTWHYYRTPAYPLVLRLATALFGSNALAVQLPNFLYGFGGIALLAYTLTKLRRPFTAVGTVLLLTLFPVLIAYEHGIFTETGSFFFLSALVCLLSAEFRSGWIKPLVAAVILALGFYHRMTLLYLSPLVALICAAELLWNPALKSRWRSAAFTLIGVVLVPYLAAQPFNRALYARPDHHYVGAMTIYGLLKQAVPEPSDALVLQDRVAYELAIASSSPSGSLDWGGISQASMLPIQDLIYSRLKESPWRAFLETCWRNPLRYTKGIARSLVYFVGARSEEDENGLYVREVILNPDAGSKIFGANHPDYSVACRTFARAGTTTSFSTLIRVLIGVYRILLALGCVATAVGLIVSVLRRDRRLFTFCAVPAFLIGLHVLLQITINRYAVPAYPLILANLLVVPAFVWKRRSNEPLTEPQESGTRVDAIQHSATLRS